MRILTVGDVVGECGVNYLTSNLKRIIFENQIDFTIVNGENALSGSGIDKETCEAIFNCDCDCITLGNHAFNKKSVSKAFDTYQKSVLRPINYDGSLDGEGYTILEKSNERIAVINAVGRIFMNDCNCPFKSCDKVLEYLEESNIKIIIVDFHAEATSEKKAMGYYLDGRVSAVFGTHTHTPTADEQILPLGTGFITDIGMTGSQNSILGLKKEISINKIVYDKKAKYEWATDNPALMGAIFDINEKDGKCTNVLRVRF